VKVPPLPPRIVLVALGTVPRALIADVGVSLTAVYGAPVIAGPAQQQPEYAFNRERQQYHSTAILRRVAQVRSAREDVPVLGLTGVDLFVPEAPFVFGEADRGARAAVLSFSRLGHGAEGRPADREQLLRRTRVEALHQVGLLLGLPLCPDARCAMSASRKLSDLDRKAVGLCDACRAAVGPGIT
jgi:archaemetzincin